MTSSLNEYEVRILKAVAGQEPWPEWGAWVGAALEFLQDDGLVTRGQTLAMPQLTDKGREVIKGLL